MTRLRGVCAGAGYFGQFHYDAWLRLDGVEIVAVCDPDAARAAEVRSRFGVPRQYADVGEALDAERPDFVDVITPPPTHLGLIREAAARGVHVLCQKPLAPSLEEAGRVVATARDAGIRLMVHDNFRFQPWHREIKRLLDDGTIGHTLHSLTFRSRPGDGWGPVAYRARQPYFRTMPRLLVFETGVHFIDTFRYLAGEVRRAYALLRRLNPVIAGEDCGLLVLEFDCGGVGIWDANRYNESNGPDPRYTFGEFLVEGDGGTIRLALDGSLSVKKLGEPEQPHAYAHKRRGFAGDCVHETQRHFIERLRDGRAFETEGEDYLRTLIVQEAVYESSRRRAPVDVAEIAHPLPPP